MPALASLTRPAEVLAGPLARRCRVPRSRAGLDAVTSFGREADPADAGLTRDAVESIWSAALDWYRTGAHPAIQLCLRRNGHVVLDRAIGHARGNGPGEDGSAAERVGVDTPFCVYSASKSWTATLVLMLAERGALRLDDLVVDHLPEYGRHGKETTTVAHLLTHRAAVPYLPRRIVDLDRIGDDGFIRDAIAELRPLGRPGGRLAYHALTAGFVLGEIVRSATGRGIRDLLHDEILDPLGFRWSSYGVAADDVDRVGRTYLTGLPIVPPVSTQLGRALSGSLADAVATSNDPRFLTAVVPSANVVTTAWEMSRFYELLRRGGELDGVRVLHPETMKLATTQTAHLEPDRVLGFFPVRYGYGYMLGARYLSLYGQDTDWAFGHLGLSNVIGWADPRRGLAGGLITSGKAALYPGIERFLRLTNRIAARVPKVSPAELAW